MRQRRAQNVVSPVRKKVSEEEEEEETNVCRRCKGVRGGRCRHSLAAFLEKRTTRRGEQEEKEEDGKEEEEEEDVLMTPREIIDNLPSILDLESDVPVVVDLVDFSTLCKQYVKRDGDVDELVKLFSESEYNSAKFLEGAFDVVYEAKMAMRKTKK